jgi:hypothetical protein
MFDKIKHEAIAALGAAIFTFTAVGAAVGPARAVETAQIVYVQADVSGHANA